MNSRIRIALALSLAVSMAACKSKSASETNPASAPAEGATKTATGTCGDKGLPDCPTQSWMKSNLQTYVRTKDFARLEKALQKLSAAAPEGYEGWSDIADLGAQAANASDERGVKAQCSACHEKFRKRFKTERRTEPLALQ